MYGPSYLDMILSADFGANKNIYAWNDHAINIYFNNGGYSSAHFPWENRGLVVSSYALLQAGIDETPGQAFAPSYKVAGNLLHEIGHYFENRQNRPHLQTRWGMEEILKMSSSALGGLPLQFIKLHDKARLQGIVERMEAEIERRKSHDRQRLLFGLRNER